MFLLNEICSCRDRSAPKLLPFRYVTGDVLSLLTALRTCERMREALHALPSKKYPLRNIGRDLSSTSTSGQTTMAHHISSSRFFFTSFKRRNTPYFVMHIYKFLSLERRGNTAQKKMHEPYFTSLINYTVFSKTIFCKS